ncbi:hypothetical protein OG320_18435 [Microbispora sp. NBC_01189]|uniref:hypothetical protein n=1 Tax=Microbispora sp. NBC_01189 TaxID=2903583 RepID=UPI002E14915F|nr:hypothetical protein OG320_18435 [Microbispora sp. NBC_01189]
MKTSDSGVPYDSLMVPLWVHFAAAAEEDERVLEEASSFAGMMVVLTVAFFNASSGWHL